MKGFISFKTRLLMGFGAVIFIMILLMGLALQQFYSARTGIAQLHDQVSPEAWAAEKMALDIVQVQQFLTDVSATHHPEGYQEAEAFAEDFQKTLKQFREFDLSTTQVSELAVIEKDFAAFYESGKRMAASYISGGTEAGNVLMEDFDNTSLVLAERMTKFRDAAVEHEKSITSNLETSAGDAANLIMLMAGFGLLASVLIAVWLTGYLGKQLGIDPFYAKGMALEIAKGNLERAITLDSNDKSSLLYAMKQMQTQILGRMRTADRLIDEVTRVKIALDNVSTGVMIADNDRKIIYVNRAIVSLLGKIELDLRKELPSFSVEKLIGSNIDSFHKNPAHQANLLFTATESFKSTLVLHGHHLVITASPVIDEEGRRLGTAAEWLDRTDEVSVETEMAEAINASVNGDFSYRINSHGLDGFYKQAGTGINKLLDVCDEGLNEVVRVLSAVAQGDLTDSITNEYSGTFGQLKDDTNNTVAKLKDIISQIKDASDNINTGAKEIASGNNDLSHRTEEQAASLEQTAASMHELTATVQHNAENAKRANDLAINAAKIAGKGGEVVGKVVLTMEDINQSSRRIVDIISVIDGIAFQTNILALNAAVEAARAGDQGRGFAVVAAEVRNLAQRAAAAAGEIKSLIGDSVEKVEEGTKLVDNAGKTMVEIVNSIKGVTAMMASITKASEEQGTGIEQVNQAISQMDDVTQQNAALVEQAAAAAESLEEQAQGLSIMVGSFVVDVNARSVGGGSSNSKALPKQTRLASPVISDIPINNKVVAVVDEWEEF